MTNADLIAEGIQQMRQQLQELAGKLDAAERHANNGDYHAAALLMHGVAHTATNLEFRAESAGRYCTGAANG